MGPGVVPGAREATVSNIDLAPTFEDLAGLESPAYRSGISLVPTFADPSIALQDYVFFEHTSSRSRPGADPDRAFTGGGLNVIPSYVAVRSRTALLVRNDLDRRWNRHRYAYEFYDLTRERWEKTNQYADPAHAAEVATLMAKLDEWDSCSRLRGSQPVSAPCQSLTSGSRSAVHRSGDCVPGAIERRLCLPRLFRSLAPTATSDRRESAHVQAQPPPGIGGRSSSRCSLPPAPPGCAWLATCRTTTTGPQVRSLTSARFRPSRIQRQGIAAPTSSSC